MNFYPDIRSLHNAYKSGKVTPLKYVSYLLETIESSDIDRGTFTTILKDRALYEAKKSSERWSAGRSLGLFDGIPTVWKDLFDIEGTITTGSSLAYIDAPLAKKDAPCVDFYSKNGGVNLAKVGLSEFAYSALGINPHMGTPTNAFKQELFQKNKECSEKIKDKRVPGGSSSGTAVAVSREYVSVGMGTDTSGSIRIPAAWHGLYGYKPSFDFYKNKTGIMPLSTTLDTFGPIARSLQDCYDFYCLFQEKRPSLLTKLPASKVEYRCLIPSNIWTSAIDSDVCKAFDKVVIKLSSAGFNIEYVEVPEIDAVNDIMARYGTFASAESSYYHKNILKAEKYREKIHPRVLSRMNRAQSMSAIDYITLHKLRDRLITEMKDLYQNTFFIMPTVPMIAPLISIFENNDELFYAENLRAMSLTVAGNFLGWDSITLPMGVGDEGMPLGLMISSCDKNITDLFKVSNNIDISIGNIK